MPTGKTNDAGWQIGVSRTLDATPEAVWELLVSERGLAIWLGDGAALDPETGRWTSDAAAGEVRSYHAVDRVRLRLPTDDGTHVTTTQLAVQATADGRTVLVLHEEHLRDPGERIRRRTHWRGVADRIQSALVT